MRKNNVEDMTIREQLEAVCEKICTDYCRYPAFYHERLLRDEFKTEDEAMDALGDEICVSCPMMRL